MKKFNFRFENVKKIREYESEQAKELLDKAVLNRIECESLIEETEAEINSLISDLSEMTAKEKLEIHLIMNLRNFIAVKRLDKEREERKLVELKKVEEEVREEYIETRKELKKLKSQKKKIL